VTVLTRTLAAMPHDSANHGLPLAAPADETVDQLCVRRLDWLKINMDIAAADVIAGASETLWRLRPRLIATLPTEAASTQLAESLKEFGYRCWRLETPLFNTANFNRHDRDVFAGRSVWTLLGIPEEIEVDVALDGCVEIS